ncbi:translation initiation factor 3 subunit TIF3K1 [Acrasis kona]|uniref:Eukaryotic translation initiation factor 3 subunit K n=1 Tax=Acrasis kona TaxID=1008807 RepID=A0AAW2Z446_9EUKA
MSKQPIKIGNFQYQPSDATSKYDAAVIAPLEKHVQEQLTNDGTYDKEANLFLLKLYQFHPQKASLDVIKKVLILALTNGSQTNDFTLSLYLIHEKNQSEEGVSQLIKLYDLLEACQFDKFWELRATASEVLKSLPSFDNNILFAGVLAITYQEADKAVIMKALNFNDTKSFDEFVNSHNEFFRGTQDNTVRFALNSYNQILPKKVPQNIKFERKTNYLLRNNLHFYRGFRYWKELKI